MKRFILNPRDLWLLVTLMILISGLCYYLLFYVPLCEEMNAIEAQSAECDIQIAIAQGKLAEMEEMQSQLDGIFSRPAEEITELAPFDNKENVLNQLYVILSRASDYTLNFTDPEIRSDGTVRRSVTMRFNCETYSDAKAVIRDLTDSHWRCLISHLSILCEEGDMMTGTVKVTATITFFEHTGLN